MDEQSSQPDELNQFPEDPLKRPALIILLVTTPLWGLLFLPATFLALMTTMIFDHPGEDLCVIWTFAITIFTFPLICLISIATSWIAYGAKTFVWAVFLSFLPVINLVLFLITSIKMS